MQLKYGFISVDDHVQETPNLWVDRLKKKFGDRVPHLVTAKDGSEQWIFDGQMLLDGRAARAGALMADRNEDPKRWADVPAPAFTPSGAIENDGCCRHRLFGALPDGGRFGRRDIRPRARFRFGDRLRASV